MIKNVVTILFLVVFAIAIKAQEPAEIVRLKQRAQASVSDTQLVNIYNNLAREYSKSNFDSVQHYSHKCLTVAKRSGSAKSLYLG
ncbi:MAG: hypothetical protein M0D57_09510 [Sphingobacteriales bacterium JAD_PAG50586_3]|nr:MAG: hypothetical protein M0D57_09510 [Sphingobacteriales bacterium JAD_PAG50586_3]